MLRKSCAIKIVSSPVTILDYQIGENTSLT